MKPKIPRSFQEFGFTSSNQLKNILEKFTVFAVILTEQKPLVAYIQHIYLLCFSWDMSHSPQPYKLAWFFYFFPPFFHVDIFHVLELQNIFHIKENCRLNNSEFFSRQRNFVYTKHTVEKSVNFFSPFCFYFFFQKATCVLYINKSDFYVFAN